MYVSVNFGQLSLLFESATRATLFISLSRESKTVKIEFLDLEELSLKWSRSNAAERKI